MIHLHSVHDHVDDGVMHLNEGVQPIFFVIQRGNGHWSVAAKIMSLFPSEDLAEAEAKRLKDEYPQQTFGVAQLRSEARIVPDPIEIVRVETQQ